MSREFFRKKNISSVVGSQTLILRNSEYIFAVTDRLGGRDVCVQRPKRAHGVITSRESRESHEFVLSLWRDWQYYCVARLRYLLQPLQYICIGPCSISALKSQCGAPIKSPHCIRSRTALSLSSHRIDFAHAPHCVFEGALNIVS